MIERPFVKNKLRAFRINEFIKANTTGAGFSHSLVQRTPLGEKIVIYASRPRLVVGSGGQNIGSIVKTQKKRNRKGKLGKNARGGKHKRDRKRTNNTALGRRAEARSQHAQ